MRKGSAAGRVLPVVVMASVSAALWAQAPAPASPAASGQAGGMVEWVQRPLPTHKPQTDAEAEQGRQMGRTLPAREMLQPVLDPALVPYARRTDVQLSGTFKGAASDVLPGLVRAWVEAFQRLYPNVHIDVPPPYAGSLGAKELVSGSLDFVFVSRELKPDDITDFQAKFGYPPLSVPVSGGSYRHFGFLDAVAFFVNKQNPMETITFAQLDRILSSTHYRGGAPAATWGDLGLTGEWAQRPVHVYAIQPWNGFEEFIRQRVLSVEGKRGEWRTDLHFDKVVFPVAGRVAADPDGIGYSGVAYIDAPVKMLALQAADSGEPSAPTYENVVRATYPLSRLVYFNVNRPAGKALNPVLQEFLKFILSRDGQQIVRDQNVFIPLRAAQVQQARQLFDAR